jgi:hypothetical protein
MFIKIELEFMFTCEQQQQTFPSLSFLYYRLLYCPGYFLSRVLFPFPNEKFLNWKIAKVFAFFSELRDCP